MRALQFCFSSALLLLAAVPAAARVPIVTAPRPHPLERLAADELARHLALIYPQEQFAVETKDPGRGIAILLAVDPRAVKTPEGFVVASRRRAGAAVGTITGADPRGVLFGVYALLEKLGFGFYLSYDTAPPPRSGAFSPDGWQLADAPLYADRIVFDWHNFLSSCSTWELADWQRYINQSAKMRFNGLMVHAYGNNPIFAFRHHGQEKAIGYLATTIRGRDWGTQHVNDVRRLIGGDLFQAPAFGASFALGAEEQRGAAATALMQKVFAHAHSRGLRVTFALDVDTDSANPQNILATLPDSAIVTDGKLRLANPETPEGYAYYQDQVRQLFATYPEIDRLAVWFRNNQTPWRRVLPERFPPKWKSEFDAAVAANPAIAKDPEAPGMFVMAKLIAAYRRAARDAGRAGVEIATGSWRFHWLKAADALIPRDVPILPLDWQVVFDKPESGQLFTEIGAHRKMLPIVWAHHDDRTYIGRPYTPFPKFGSMLKSTNSAGFGIIHWTTRPLDLYFKSTVTQVWQATRDQPLTQTCADMAARTFGEGARAAGGEYLAAWATDGRMFGRETTDRFIDVELKDASEVIAGCRRRLAMLDRVPAAGSEWLEYFRGYEQFVERFFASHAAWERARALAKTGDWQGAAAALAAGRPEETIAAYARAIRRVGQNPGERAILISLNLRWLPYFLSTRQALGLEAVRLRFAPTLHEPLAQGAGHNTFLADDGGRLWKVLGERETTLPASDRGVRVDGEAHLKLGAIMDDPLAPGTYRVDVALNGAAELEAAGQKARAEGGRATLTLKVTDPTVMLTVRAQGGPVYVQSAEIHPVR